MRLSKMFKDAPTVNINGLARDSRMVKEGDLYFCLPGMRFDGHEFIDQALENGAIGIVHTREDIEKKEGAIYIQVEDALEALNRAANIFYGKPASKMKMFGVTGTNGKTSVANIIRHLLNEKNSCGYIGTIAISYGNNVLTPDLTTPDSLLLLKTLRDMVNSRMDACALEVSSHGLAQHRVDPIDFDVAVFTNFTHDHLDFHKTMDHYFQSKALLFEERLKPEGIAVLNRDDPVYDELQKRSHGKIVSYGLSRKADYQATDISLSETGTDFELVYNRNRYPVHTNLSGLVNVSNLLAAIAAVHQSGIDLEKILEACENIPQIPGRFEQIKAGQPFKVVVDFAHTPDGMKKIMEYGAAITPRNNKLISVFGSAGQRDIAKRKVFGQIADQYCHDIILTEDDPRNEDAKEIAEQISQGISKNHWIFIPDRYEAIRQAIEKAGPQDTVLILGKGDEPFMYRENGREPWIGDNKAALESIERMGWKNNDNPVQDGQS